MLPLQRLRAWSQHELDSHIDGLTPMFFLAASGVDDRDILQKLGLLVSELNTPQTGMLIPWKVQWMGEIRGCFFSLSLFCHALLSLCFLCYRAHFQVLGLLVCKTRITLIPIPPTSVSCCENQISFFSFCQVPVDIWFGTPSRFWTFSVLFLQISSFWRFF